MLSGCGVPKDPEGTLDRVSGGVLRVGVTDAPPWAESDGTDLSGIEVALVQGFADSVDAEIEWIEGSETELAQAVFLGEIDMMIGGLTSTSTLASEVTLTHPYLTTATVIGVPDDADIPSDIAGVEVAVETGTAEAGLLAKTDAEVLRVDDITTVDGPIAVEDIFLDDLSMTDTGIRLQESDHVMGVPHGENAFLVELERFLLDHADLAQQLVERAQP
jgi:polar amino acid transport system substrate-binding protein